MIYRLQKRMIFVSFMSILCVFLLIFLAIFLFATISLNRTADMLTDELTREGGSFPEEIPPNERPKPEGEQEKFPFGGLDFITQETPFNTRYFTVYYDSEGALSEVNTDRIILVDETTAVEYANDAVSGGHERGWEGVYRYKVFENAEGRAVVFVDASMNRTMTIRLLLIVGAVLLFSLLLALLIILLLSRRAVRPIAESYGKQKRFITDAGHELKTPLTLILTNLDIAESQVGKSEWLDDMRQEGNRMARLIGELVSLSRMDEEGTSMPTEPFSLSDSLSDTASEFAHLAYATGTDFRTEIEENITLNGNEESIRRLFSILLDNAVKYCDAGGYIAVRLMKKRNIIFEIENSYAEVEKVDISQLFERFYRADKARTQTGGFGIGLSSAKAIVEKHGATITAYPKRNEGIGFRVVFSHK